MKRSNLRGVFDHECSVCGILDSIHHRGGAHVASGVGILVWPWAALSGHKPAGLDIGRGDLSCWVAVPVCALASCQVRDTEFVHMDFGDVNLSFAMLRHLHS
jgi:hypothetical protein